MHLLRKPDVYSTAQDRWRAILDDRLQVLAAYEKIARRGGYSRSFLRRIIEAFTGQDRDPLLQFDLLQPVADGAGSCRRIAAVAEGLALHRHQLRASIAGLSTHLIKGGTIEIQIASSDGTYDGGLHPIAGDLQTAMLVSGLYLERIELYPDEVSARGRKALDWTRIIREPDSRSFVQSLYKQVLRRDADPAGLENYLSELRAGASRRHLLRTFLTSDERWALAERCYPAQMYDRA